MLDGNVLVNLSPDPDSDLAVTFGILDLDSSTAGLALSTTHLDHNTLVMLNGFPGPPIAMDESFPLSFYATYSEPVLDLAAQLQRGGNPQTRAFLTFLFLS